MPQYAKPLTLNKGVDNQIQFQFLNQEQKPVDITDKEITCRIINYQGNKILVQKALTLELPVTGIASLYLNVSDLEDIDTQKCYYSLEIPVNSFDFPVFVDQNAGARGEINIVNSILPSFVPSLEVTIPSGQAFANTNWIPNTYYNPDPNSTVYYTSVVSTNGSPLTTLQATYTDFYGNVMVEGSTNVDSDWYSVSNLYNYSNESNTNYYNVVGFHPYIRIAFVSNAGVVTNVLAR